MARSKKGQSARDAVQGITQAAYARKRGVSREAIRKAVESGRIPVLRRGRINPRVADKAFRDNTDPSKLRGRRAAAAGSPKLYESKARREQALAELAELELAERRGELVPESRVREQAFNAARQTRDQLLAIPDRLAPMLVGRDNQLEVHQILSDELRRVCGAIAGDAPEPAPAPPAPAPPPEASA